MSHTVTTEYGEAKVIQYPDCFSCHMEFGPGERGARTTAVCDGDTEEEAVQKAIETARYWIPRLIVQGETKARHLADKVNARTKAAKGGN